jgi:hypothetical protein
MVKLATSVLAVSLLALPALAAPAERYERSVAESDLYDRDLANVGNIIVTREDLYEIFGREFVDDIEERSPFGLGAIFHVAKAIAGKVGHHSHHHIPSVDLNSNNNNNNNNRREFDEEEFDLRDFDEDLEAREPIDVEKVLHRAHRVYRAAQYIPTGNYNDRRDLVEEVFEREFDDEELLEREYYDDLD